MRQVRRVDAEETSEVVAGFAVFAYGSSAKWLELLKQIAPGVTRVGSSDTPHSPGRTIWRDPGRGAFEVE
jgi:hypothetical protein